MTTEIQTDIHQARRAVVRAKLKALRDKLSCSQKELADVLGVNTSYINLIEGRATTYNIEHAEQTARQAYAQFNAPFDDQTAFEQMTLPGLAATVSTPAPAEVESEALSRITRSEVARRIETFKQEFQLRPPELARLFGVSGGHEYVLRMGKEGSGSQMRKKVIAVIKKETARRRAAARNVQVTAPTAPPSQVTAAPTPRVETPDVVLPAAVVRDDHALAQAITFDGATAHRFHKLPDGSILVVKGA